MLQKTFTGPEILEIVKDHLSRNGLNMLGVTYDDIGLNGCSTMQLEVEVNDVNTNTDLLWPPGCRSINHLTNNDLVFGKDGGIVGRQVVSQAIPGDLK